MTTRANVVDWPCSNLSRIGHDETNRNFDSSLFKLAAFAASPGARRVPAKAGVVPRERKCSRGLSFDTSNANRVPIGHRFMANRYANEWLRVQWTRTTRLKVRCDKVLLTKAAGVTSGCVNSPASAWQTIARGCSESKRPTDRRCTPAADHPQKHAGGGLSHSLPPGVIRQPVRSTADTAPTIL